MASFAKLNVLLTADATQFQSTFARAGKTLNDFGNVMISTAKKTALFVGGIVGIAEIGFSVLIKRSFETIDSLGRLSDQLGINTKQLAGLQFAAQQTGVGISVLNRSLTAMVKKLGDVQIGKGDKIAETLRKIGLSAVTLSKLKPEEALRKIADGIRGLPTQARKISITAEIFGTPELVNVLNLGSKALKIMTEQAKFLGIAISGVDVSVIRSANQAFGRLATAIKGAAARAALNLAPSLERLADAFTPLVVVLGEMIKSSLPKLVDFLAEKIPNAFVLLLGFMKDMKIAIIELVKVIVEQIEQLLSKIAEISGVQVLTFDPTGVPGGFGRGIAIIREALGKDPFQPIRLGKIPFLSKEAEAAAELAGNAAMILRGTIKGLNKTLKEAKGPDEFFSRMIENAKKATVTARDLREALDAAVAAPAKPTVPTIAPGLGLFGLLGKFFKTIKLPTPKPQPIPELVQLASIDDRIQKAAFEEVDLAKQQVTLLGQIKTILGNLGVTFAGP